ncbi:MAG: 3-methyl-2-oxobutanoate hydroxymethyltransferase [Candidatus Methylopumilus sp.]
MSLEKIQSLVASDEKIAMLTCYDATFAKLCEAAGVDMLLVGDSLGMVLQGAENTLKVSMQDMEYHTKSVAAGSTHCCIMADMPAGSYEQNQASALQNAKKLLAAGADIVKIEGAGDIVSTAEYLIKHGVPVCAHLGFTPQSVNQLGGYRIQGKTQESAERILQDAIAMDKVGVSFVLLEMVPAALAKTIAESIATPIIGIGAGADCAGQVLVLQDLLGIYTGPASKKPEDFKAPRFAKNFLADHHSIQAAVQAYVSAVKNKTFPSAEHCY